MSERVSTQQGGRRRDGDPVRVFSDGRVGYYESGTPGVGKRRFRRCGSVDAAEEFAVKLRARLQRSHSLDERARLPLVEVMRAFVAQAPSLGRAPSTVRQYRSNWNCWVPEEVRTTRCCDLTIAHWTAVFDGLAREGASVSTVRAVARTLGALIEFGADRGYFEDGEPFGSRLRRQRVVRSAVKGAPRRTRVAGRGPQVADVLDSSGDISLDRCPTLEEVEKYAAACEVFYPGYGSRLVMLSFASGLRLCEALALRVASVDLELGQVRVTSQLDRTRPWPELKAPKGGRSRTTIVWASFLDVARSLVADAEARDGDFHGWLFPPDRPTTGWADRAGRLLRLGRVACDWPWSHHWLRHAFASFSLAPMSAGGYGFDTASVQGWLGHRLPTTTLDTYVERQRFDEQRTRAVTSRLPGVVETTP